MNPQPQEFKIQPGKESAAVQANFVHALRGIAAEIAKLPKETFTKGA